MNTVFILGAGASQPYGFPSGYTLVGEIVSQLAGLKRYLTSMRDVYALAKFKSVLENAKPWAIDDILIQRPEFLKIGKVAITSALSRYERIEVLQNRELEDDWYSYFFEHIRKLPQPVYAEQFSFISFNYDRSLEQYLRMATDAFYGETDAIKSKCIREIPILHIHGQLGSLANIPYGFSSNDEREFIIGEISEHLNLTDEETDKDTLARAHELIQRASKIRFLGFGFHDTNLKKLELQKNAVNCNDLAGTTYGLKENKVREIKNKHSALKNMRTKSVKIVDFFETHYSL